MELFCIRGAAVTAFVVIVFSFSAVAQCATGTVLVYGEIQNVSIHRGQVRISVALNSPKGRFSKTAELMTDNSFRVEVPFSTFQSWSPLRGHRCTSAPKTVEIKVLDDRQVVVERTLKFGDYFNRENSLDYRLKHELRIDASKSTDFADP